MTRELKFRIWMPEAPHPYSETGMFYQEDQWLGSFLRRIHDQFGIRHDTYLPFEVEERLMQFTGYRDNTKWEELTEAERTKWTASGNLPSDWKGKDIYEGDIVEYFSEVGNHHHTETIELEEHETQWSDFVIGFAIGHNNRRVIGNIYENPELVKKS